MKKGLLQHLENKLKIKFKIKSLLKFLQFF